MVVVRVDSAGLTAADVSNVTITVTDVGGASDAGSVAYQSPQLRICSAGQTKDCYAFPISVTLAPGSRAPNTKLRVEVDAVAPDGSPFSSDAAVFSFTSRTDKSIDFFLSRNCLGTSCAWANPACGSFGTCSTVTAREGNGAPDLATPPSTGGSLVRTSFATNFSNGSSLQLVPPVTLPGDLVLVVLSSRLPTQSLPDQPGWQLLAEQTEETAIIYRYAAADEASNIDLYHLRLQQSLDVDPNTGVSSTIIVYRGAHHIDNGTNLLTPPITFFAVQSVARGDLVVGVLVADRPVCPSMPAFSDSIQSASSALLELPRPQRPLPSMPTATPTGAATPAGSTSWCCGRDARRSVRSARPGTEVPTIIAGDDVHRDDVGAVNTTNVTVLEVQPTISGSTPALAMFLVP